MKEMKLIMLGIICFGISADKINAQIMQPGNMTVSVGYGFPTLTKTVFSVIDGQNISTNYIGPVYGKFEYMINETVGFGMNFAYTYGSASYQTSGAETDSLFYNTSFKYKSYSALARFNFHFGNSTNFDPYAGVGLGYRNSNYSYTSGDPNYDPKDINGFNHFGLDFTIGARLFFTENIGVYGEVGVAKSPMQVGIIAKF